MGMKALEYCLQGPIVGERVGASLKGRKPGRVLRTGVAASRKERVISLANPRICHREDGRPEGALKSVVPFPGHLGTETWFARICLLHEQVGFHVVPLSP